MFLGKIDGEDSVVRISVDGAVWYFNKVKYQASPRYREYGATGTASMSIHSAELTSRKPRARLHRTGMENVSRPRRSPPCSPLLKLAPSERPSARRRSLQQL